MKKQKQTLYSKPVCYLFMRFNIQGKLKGRTVYKLQNSNFWVRVTKDKTLKFVCVRGSVRETEIKNKKAII